MMKLKTYLNESSLSRLWKHMQDHDTGVMTAYRSKEFDDDGNIVKEYTRKENKARNSWLSAKLLRKYSVTRVKGAYIENYGSPEAEEVGEATLFVTDLNNTGNLKKDLKKLGNELNQDSIMFISKGSNKALLIGTKKDEYSNIRAWPDYGVIVTLPKAVWGKEAQFMTKVRGRPFLFTEQDEFGKRLDIQPQGFFGNWSCHAVSTVKSWRDLM